MSSIIDNKEKKSFLDEYKWWIIGAVGVLVFGILLYVFIFADSATEKTPFTSQYEGVQKGDTVAEMDIKDYGTVKIRLFPEQAPKAVENFIGLSKQGYYNGVTFHRVMNDFMIQGGDPTATGSGGESIWGEDFEDEFSKDLIPIRGALCMANAGANTNGSQFFIVQCKSYDIAHVMNMRSKGVNSDLVDYYKEVGGSGHLYEAHTVFGQVFEGMDIVDKIAAVETDSNNKPNEDVVIETIRIREY